MKVYSTSRTHACGGIEEKKKKLCGRISFDIQFRLSFSVRVEGSYGLSVTREKRIACQDFYMRKLIEKVLAGS